MNLRVRYLVIGGATWLYMIARQRHSLSFAGGAWKSYSWTHHEIGGNKDMEEYFRL